MRAATDLSPNEQLLLDYLRGHWQADQFDIQQNLGMSLASALVVADELRAAGCPIEVRRARFAYFRLTEAIK